MISDLFEENKEVKRQLTEVTSKTESLQSELLEANKTNFFLEQKLDEYDLAIKIFQESLTKKNESDQRSAWSRETHKTIPFYWSWNRYPTRRSGSTNSSRGWKAVRVQAVDGKQWEIRVENDIQRAEAVQLIQAVDGKQLEKLERSLHALVTHTNHWDWKDYGKYSIFDVKRGNIESCLSTIYYPIAYSFDKDPNWKQKCTRPPWPINPKNVITGENNWSWRRKQSEVLERLTHKYLFMTIKLFVLGNILYPSTFI